MKDENRLILHTYITYLQSINAIFQSCFTHFSASLKVHVYVIK